MPLNELAAAIYAVNAQKGFWDDKEKKNKGEMLMLVTSELAEALEADRENRYADLTGRFPENHEHYLGESTDWFKENVKDSFEDEIADAVIRLLDISAGLGIDIDWHVKSKLAYNKTRSHKHGGKKY